MFGRRLGLLLFVFFGGACIVVLRLWWAQFIAADDIQRLALTSRAVDIELPAARGSISDASGTVLARDRASFDVQLVPSTFRERALLHAVVDLQVLLDPREEGGRGPEGSGGVRDLGLLRAAVRSNPRRFVGRILSLPASRVDRERLDEVGRVLCESEPGGDLIRVKGEMVFRLRQCLGVLQGRGLPFTRGDLEGVKRHHEDLASALELTVEEVVRRLETEIRVIEEVGASVGFEAPSETWTALDDLVHREIRWINRYREAEASALLSLEEFGSPVLRPGRVPADVYLDVARGVDLPFETDERSRDVAWRSLQGARALLSGRLPDPSLGRYRPMDQAIVPTPPESTLEEADAFGLLDLDPRRVRAEWFRSQANRDEALLSPRQDRDIRNRYRGGRAFAFGVGAPAGVAGRVIGPGRLQTIGFRLVPGFVRDAALRDGLPAIVQLMIGDVTRRGRKGWVGAEASLDERLVGKKGVASIDREGGMTLTEVPVDGEDITLSFSVDVIQRLQKEVVPPGRRFGLAVIDVHTGGVVGIASGPAPEDAAAARAERLAAEIERRELMRAKEMELGEILQDRAFLARRTELTKRERIRQSVLSRVEDFGHDWLDARLRELNVAEADATGWHRAYELPGHCPPGSVFKALTILEGLRKGVIDASTTFDCGHDTKRRHFHKCKAHGFGLGIRTVLAKSCNEACYQVGRLLTAGRMRSFYEELGLHDTIPGLPVQRPSRYLLARADAENLSIGGQDLHCVPVRAAGLAASIARGRVVHPWIAGPAREVGAPLVPAGSEWMLTLVREGMKDVCGTDGTASGFASELRRLRVAAKTGTADHKGPGGHEVHEAWFVGFAPFDDPRLAFAVVLPNARADQPGLPGEEGAEAAPYAVQALEICAEAMGIRWW